MKIVVWILFINGLFQIVGTTNNYIADACFTVVAHRVNYNGTKQTTLTGITCQRWDEQSPHTHKIKYRATDFPDEKLSAAENFCRDPDDKGFPWCFTTDPKIRWMACGIAPCEKPQCYTVVNGKAVYNGTMSKTIKKEKCQRWDKQFPHRHFATNPADFSVTSLSEVHNYCRDPDSTGFPWCYTRNPSVSWRMCDVPKCIDDCFTQSPDDSVYKGTKKTTITGISCQRWDKQSPNVHDKTNPDLFPYGSISRSENFCRDPDKTGYPYCITMDPEIPTMICGIFPCTVHGAWSLWVSGEKTQCSTTCGTGSVLIHKTRTCDNPAPVFAGRKCVGSSNMTFIKSCYTGITCPEFYLSESSALARIILIVGLTVFGLLVIVVVILLILRKIKLNRQGKTLKNDLHVQFEPYKKSLSHLSERVRSSPQPLIKRVGELTDRLTVMMHKQHPADDEQNVLDNNEFTSAMETEVTEETGSSSVTCQTCKTENETSVGQEETASKTTSVKTFTFSQTIDGPDVVS